MTGRIVLDDVDEASAQLLLYELSIGEHEAERCGYFTRRPPLLELRRQATEIAHGGPGATLTPCQVPPSSTARSTHEHDAPPEWDTVALASAALGVSERTGWRRLERGELERTPNGRIRPSLAKGATQ